MLNLLEGLVLSMVVIFVCIFIYTISGINNKGDF